MANTILVDGYRLTQQGYDFLALNALHSREIVGFVFEKIGVGKESQIFLAADAKRDVSLIFICKFFFASNILFSIFYKIVKFKIVLL